MAVPTNETLATELGVYVDAEGTEHAGFVRECVDEAVAFIVKRVPNIVTTTIEDDIVLVDEESPLGDELYRREVKELGSELFYRRAARNGVVNVRTMEGTPIRVAADPWKAAEARLTRHRPLGFA